MSRTQKFPMLLSGRIVAVPLDDGRLLEAAGPDGGMRTNPAAVRAGHDGRVKRALAAGPVAVLVLGGAHDLSEGVRRLGGGTTEYIRVMPGRFAEASR